jgi:hypothetical protein
VINTKAAQIRNSDNEEEFEFMDSIILKSCKFDERLSNLAKPFLSQYVLREMF